MLLLATARVLQLILSLALPSVPVIVRYSRVLEGSDSDLPRTSGLAVATDFSPRRQGENCPSEFVLLHRDP
jgi:hypothetical protein